MLPWEVVFLEDLGLCLHSFWTSQTLESPASSHQLQMINFFGLHFFLAQLQQHPSAYAHAENQAVWKGVPHSLWYHSNSCVAGTFPALQMRKRGDSGRLGKTQVTQLLSDTMTAERWEQKPKSVSYRICISFEKQAMILLLFSVNLWLTREDKRRTGWVSHTHTHTKSKTNKNNSPHHIHIWKLAETFLLPFLEITV